ncbi:MAG: tyrosine-protein phosphatase [Pseudomonadota bacterium]
MRVTPLTIDRLAVPAGGTLALCRCPGRRLPGDPGEPPPSRLDADIRALRSCGASAVVTLLETSELARLGVPRLLEAYRRHDLRFWHCPIADMQTPQSAFVRAWQDAAPELQAALGEGGCVAVHCAAGLGRTGMFAARILSLAGLAPDAAITAVRRARPGAIETRAQADYVGAAGAFGWPSRARISP